MQVSHAENKVLTPINACKEKSTFSESLAEFVSGIILEQGQIIEDGELINLSVIWIPTYYGYHTFLGVLDSYIINHTSITRMTTWRLAEKNSYVIHLTETNLSVKIIYDTINSQLSLTFPLGY